MRGMPEVSYQRWWLYLSVALAAGCQGVASRESDQRSVSTSVQLREPATESLRAELEPFVEFAESRVEETVGLIQSEATDRGARRAALAWRLEILPEMRDDLQSKPPLAMLLDSWALWLRISEYLRAGEGRALFGEHQPRAVRAAADVQRAAEALARKHLPADAYADVVQRVNAYARAHPIGGVFAHRNVEDFAQAEEARGVADAMLGLPLRAIQQMGKGLDPTVGLAQAVDRLTLLMRDYPALVRWQTELLLMEIEQLESMQTTVAGIRDVSDASQRVATVAEELPQRLREQVDALLADLDARQPELRTTLSELRDTVIQVETTSSSVRQTVQEVTQAGVVLTETAHAVESTLGAIQALRTPHASGVPEADSAAAPRPFDVQDYEHAADALTGAAREIRTLLEDVRDLIAGDTLARGSTEASAFTDSVLTQTDTRLRGVVDYAFWRAVQLALVVAAVMGSVHFVSVRWMAPKRA